MAPIAIRRVRPLRMQTSWVDGRYRAPAGWGSALQELLGDALHIGGLGLALVGLHDVADQSSGLLGIRDAERREPLLDERAERVLVHASGQVALAELELEAELRGLGGAALADLVVLGDGLLQLLAVGADDVEHQGIVHGPGEALGRAALLEPGLEHAHHVGGAPVLVLHRLLQRVVEGLLERHDAGADLMMPAIVARARPPGKRRRERRRRAARACGPRSACGRAFGGCVGTWAPVEGRHLGDYEMYVPVILVHATTQQA